MNNEQKKKKNKKILFLILLFCTAAILITGVILAYFSDMILGGGTVTTGTLDITGDYTFYINDQAASGDDLKNLNPGDVISVRATISNVGNKSAWVREVVTFTADAAVLPYLAVYSGVFTQAEFVAGTVDSGALLNLTGDTAISSVRVLDGTGTGAETEGGGGYNYIGSNTYDVAITIYFSPTAGNAAQGKDITLNVATQALQFRNNNTTEPGDTAWQAVVAL